MQTLISSKITTASLESKLRSVEIATVYQGSSSINALAEEMMVQARQLAINATLMDTVERYIEAGSNSYERITLKAEVNSLLSSVHVTNWNISLIALQIGDVAFYSNAGMPVPAYSDKEMKSIRDGALQEKMVVLSEKKELNTVIGIGFAVPFSLTNEQGLLFIYANNHCFQDVIDSNRRLILFRETGNQILSSSLNYDKTREIIENLDLDKNSGMRSLMIDNESYMISWYRNISGIGTTIILNPLKTFLQPVQNILYTSIIVMALVGAFTFFYLRFVSKLLLRIFDEIVSNTDNVSGGGKAEIVNTSIKPRNQSFNRLLVRYMMYIVLLPVLLFMMLHYFAADAVLENTIVASMSSNNAQAAERYRIFAARAEHAAMYIVTNRDIQKFITKQTKPDDAESTLMLLDVFEKSMEIAGMRYSADLYDSAGRKLFSSGDSATSLPDDVYAALSPRNGLFHLWRLSREKQMITKSQLILYRKIRLILPNMTAQDMGFAAVSFDEDDYTGIIGSTYASNWKVWLIDVDGSCLAGQDGQLPKDLKDNIPVIPSYTYKTKEYVNTYTGVKGTDWYVVSSYPIDQLIGEKRNVLLSNLALVILFAALQSILIKMSSRKMRESLNALDNNLKNWFRHQVDDFGIDVRDGDIYRIASSFNQMNSDIKRLLKEAYEAKLQEVRDEKDKQNSEMLALQAQINPHFLYNTLEMVKYLVYERDTRNAVEMIECLGNIFRAAANFDQVLIPLQEEIENAEAYLALQRMRFEKRIFWEFHLPLDTHDVMILKMILQPLLENAVVHGIDNTLRVLHIKVDMEKVDNMLRIDIFNDGAAIPAERLKEIRMLLLQNASGAGIGLYNVNRRLRLYFGSSYDIDIESEEGKGSFIHIHMPWLSRSDTVL